MCRIAVVSATDCQCVARRRQWWDARKSLGSMCVVGLAGREFYMSIGLGICMWRRNINHGCIADAKWADLLLTIVFALHGMHKTRQCRRVGGRKRWQVRCVAGHLRCHGGGYRVVGCMGGGVGYRVCSRLGSWIRRIREWWRGGGELARVLMREHATLLRWGNIVCLHLRRTPTIFRLGRRRRWEFLARRPARLLELRWLLFRRSRAGGGAAFEILEPLLQLLAWDGMSMQYGVRAITGTHGSCAGQCGSVSCGARQGRRS